MVKEPKNEKDKMKKISSKNSFIYTIC